MISCEWKRTSVRKVIGAAALVAVMGLHASAAQAAPQCKTVTGKALWTLIPSPNDPFGRILGPSDGSLKASITAIVTSLVPNNDGSLHATSNEIWVFGAQDVLQFAGVATFTPIADQPIGTVQDSLTLTVIGGSGKYAAATGTLNVRGTGYNLFGPGAGPGSSYFDVRYEGLICTAE